MQTIKIIVNKRKNECDAMNSDVRFKYLFILFFILFLLIIQFNLIFLCPLDL